MAFNITEEDIASIYYEGLKLYKGYNRAMDLYKEGISISTIIHKVYQEFGEDNERHKIWESRINYWIKGSNKPGNRTYKPHLFKGIDKLNELSLLPLNVDNEKFPPINQLASWVYWKGHVTLRKNREGKNGTEGQILFSYKSDEHKKTLENLFEQSGFKKINSTKERNTIYGESILARLFYLMGIPPERKSNETLIPRYINEIYQEKSKDAVRDFLNIYLYNRAIYSTDHIHLNLNNKTEKETAEKQTNKVLELFSFVFPEFKIGAAVYRINEGKYNTKGESTDGYHGRLSLYNQTKESMEEYFKMNIHSKPL